LPFKLACKLKSMGRDYVASDPDKTPPSSQGRGPMDHKARANMAALVVVVLLAAGAIYLVRWISHQNAIDNCLASGRRDCVPVDTSVVGK